MATLTTKGICISVESSYLPDKSRPDKNYYVYVYYVTIENKSDTTVQLLKRHWIITDGFGKKHEVKGDGVIGRTPVLDPGGKHSYQSWSPLTTKMGKMEGKYMMQNLASQEMFEVIIPSFVLIHHDLEN